MEIFGVWHANPVCLHFPAAMQKMATVAIFTQHRQRTQFLTLYYKKNTLQCAQTETVGHEAIRAVLPADYTSKFHTLTNPRGLL